jgi:hypothetical protein
MSCCCGLTFSAREWLLHAPHCASVTGRNRNARHAEVKLSAFAHLMRTNGVVLDSYEPRDVRGTVCPGCGVTTLEEAFVAHSKLCAKFDATSMQAPRGSGPDIRCYGIDTDDSAPRSTVVDVTVVAAECASHADTELSQVFSSVEKKKLEKYGPACQATKDHLVVAAVSESGALSKATLHLIDAIAANARADPLAARRHVAAVAAHAHGAAIANAERKCGVVVAPKPSLTTARTRRLIEEAPELEMRALAAGPWLKPRARPTVRQSEDAASCAPLAELPGDVLECGWSPIPARRNGVWTGSRNASLLRVAEFSLHFPQWKEQASRIASVLGGRRLTTAWLEQQAAQASPNYYDNLRAAMRLTNQLDRRGVVQPLPDVGVSALPAPSQPQPTSASDVHVTQW